MFYGPLKRSEFKVLISIIECSTIEKSNTSDHHVYTINNGQYIYKVYRWGGEMPSLNGVHLTWWPARKIRKAIDRAFLKATILTEAGQVLYGGNK